MQWLVDAFVNDRLDSTFKFRISESKKDYGTICMPTGTGKSGVMIEDILRRIRHACNNNIIINISCPTLKLSQQLVADLFETLDGILTTVRYEKDVRLGKERFALALNSSDSPYNYNTYGCNIYSGTELKSVIATAFGEQKKVIVVASCHKSLQKFVSITDDILAFSPDDTYIYNYIDESHLIPYDSWHTGDEMERVNLSKLKSNSSALYLFSATPDYNMTMELTDCVDNPYIYKMYPIDAINDNIILPPRIRCIRCNTLTSCSIYIDLLKECIEFGGYRKILVTLRSTEQLRTLRTSFEEMGIKVFSASAADGFTGGDAPITDAAEFAEAVDAWNGHCFVLQIKQLTQGTDIRTLTDCILPVANEIGSKTYRHLIQTMGRVLRAAPGERGKSYEQRTKKAGNIFFMLTPTADPNKEQCLRRFALRYYGMECALYGVNFRTPAEMTYEIESTKHKIRDRIMDKEDLIRNSVNLFGSSPAEEAAEVLKYIDSQEYYRKYKPNIPEYHLLDNRQLLKYAENLIVAIC